MSFVVRPHADGVPPAFRARFAALDTATIGHVTDRGFVPDLRPLSTPMRMLGPAVTVRTPALCGAVIREALIAARPGDVLAIEMVGARDRACWGELRTLAALTKGLAGVAIAGCVTDSRAVRALGLPVFSRGISPITTRGGGSHGEVNGTIDLDGVAVSSGDLVFGDDDGLIVVAVADAADLVVAAEAGAARDAARRRELRPAQAMACPV